MINEVSLQSWQFIEIKKVNTHITKNTHDPSLRDYMLVIIESCLKGKKYGTAEANVHLIAFLNLEHMNDDFFCHWVR